MFKLFRIISTLFLTLSVEVLLLILPFDYYADNIAFYQNQNTTVSQEQVHSVAEIYHFLNGQGELSISMTTQEHAHMEDVRKLFSYVSSLEIIFVILFFLSLSLLFWQKQRIYILRGVYLGAGLILLFNLLMLLGLFFDFQWIFTLFHRLLFSQGNWSFPETSTLITLFPGNFFQAIGTRLFLVSSGCALGIVGVCGIFFRKK